MENNINLILARYLHLAGMAFFCAGVSTVHLVRRRHMAASFSWEKRPSPRPVTKYLRRTIFVV